MRKIRIFDNLFENSASMSDDNKDVKPKNFEWTREGALTRPVFFTDGNIKDVVKFGVPQKAIAWLLEPSCLHPKDYVTACNLSSFFDVILTYDQELLDTCEKAKFYPYGGSWISDWSIPEKTKNISIIVNKHKNTTEGHLLRKEILDMYGDQMGVFGYGYNEVKSKREALAPYRFSIVVESCRQDHYFSEKLIDCLSVGTIPIYWGSKGDFDIKLGFASLPDLKGLFDHTGILSDMDNFLEGRAYYQRDFDAVLENHTKATQYKCVEDTIWNMYPEIFKEQK